MQEDSRMGMGRIVGMAAIALLLAAVAVHLVVRQAGMSPRDDVLRQRAQSALESGRTGAALSLFQSVVRREPHCVDAHIGVIRALLARHDFVAAQEAIARAERQGLSAARADVFRARLAIARGLRQLDGTGEEVSALLCDEVMQSRIRPALAALEKPALAPADEEARLVALGDAQGHILRLLALKRYALLRRQKDMAQGQQWAQVALLDRQLTALPREILMSLRARRTAYEAALLANIYGATTRIRLARCAMDESPPDAAAAAAWLAPVMASKSPAAEALRLNASAMRKPTDCDAALDRIRQIPAAAPERRYLAQAEAELLARLERWEEALRVTDGIVRLRAATRQTWFLRGRIMTELQRLDEAAIEYAHIFAQSGQRWPKGRLALARTLSAMGNHGRAVRELQEAVADCGTLSVHAEESAATLKDERYTAHLELARLQLARHSYAAALDNAGQAVYLSPNREDGLTLAGEAAKRVDARSRFLSLLLLHMAAQNWRKGPEATVRACTSHAQELKAPAALYSVAAELHEQNGDPAGALEALKRLTACDPDRPDFACRLARTYAAMDNAAEARRIYDRLLKADPGDAQAFCGIVGLETASGRYKEALALIKRGDPTLETTRGHTRLVELYLKDRSLADAIDIARAQSTGGARDVRPSAVLGELLWRSGALDKARTAFENARRGDPDYVPAYRAAFVELEAGNVERAHALLQEAVGRFPRHPVSRLGLALARRMDTAHSGIQPLAAPPESEPTLPPSLRWTLAALATDPALAQPGAGTPDSHRVFQETPSPEERIVQAVQTHPNVTLLRALYADYLIERGKRREAIAALERGLVNADADDLPLLYGKLATLCRAEGDEDGAALYDWATSQDRRSGGTQ